MTLPFMTIQIGRVGLEGHMRRIHKVDNEVRFAFAFGLNRGPFMTPPKKTPQKTTKLVKPYKCFQGQRHGFD